MFHKNTIQYNIIIDEYILEALPENDIMVIPAVNIVDETDDQQAANLAHNQP